MIVECVEPWSRSHHQNESIVSSSMEKLVEEEAQSAIPSIAKKKFGITFRKRSKWNEKILSRKH